MVNKKENQPIGNNEVNNTNMQKHDIVYKTEYTTVYETQGKEKNSTTMQYVRGNLDFDIQKLKDTSFLCVTSTKPINIGCKQTLIINTGIKFILHLTVKIQCLQHKDLVLNWVNTQSGLVPWDNHQSLHLIIHNNSGLQIVIDIGEPLAIICLMKKMQKQTTNEMPHIGNEMSKYIPSTKLIDVLDDGHDIRQEKITTYRILTAKAQEITNEEYVSRKETPIEPTEYTITTKNAEEEKEKTEDIKEENISKEIMIKNICLMTQQYEEPNMNKHTAPTWVKTNSIQNDIFGRTIGFLNMFLNGQIVDDTKLFIKLQKADPSIGPLYSKDPEVLQKQGIQIQNNIIFKIQEDTMTKVKTEKLMIPEAIVQSLISTIHDTLSHPSTYQLEKFLNRYFYIQNLGIKIKKLLCLVCKMSDSRKGEQLVSDQRSIEPEKPRELLSIDIISNLPPSSKGNTSFLIGMDVFSNYIITVPLARATSTSIANALISIFGITGIFKNLYVDADSRFQKDVVQLCFQYGIRFAAAGAHSQRANYVERGFQLLKQRLIPTLLQHKKSNAENWDTILIACTNSINLTATTNSIPRRLLFWGYEQVLQEPQISFEDKEIEEILYEASLIHEKYCKERFKNSILRNLNKTTDRRAKLQNCIGKYALLLNEKAKPLTKIKGTNYHSFKHLFTKLFRVTSAHGNILCGQNMENGSFQSAPYENWRFLTVQETFNIPAAKFFHNISEEIFPGQKIFHNRKYDRGKTLYTPATEDETDNEKIITSKEEATMNTEEQHSVFLIDRTNSKSCGIQEKQLISILKGVTKHRPKHKVTFRDEDDIYVFGTYDSVGNLDLYTDQYANEGIHNLMSNSRWDKT